MARDKDGSSDRSLTFRSYRSFSKTEVADFSNQFYQRDKRRDTRNYEPVVAPHTLLGKLESDSYLDYWFGLVNGSLALGGGCWEYNQDTVVLLARLAVLPEFRMHLLIQHLLREQLPTASVYKEAWITFNPHNQILYQWFSGRTATIGRKWPPVFPLFKPVGTRMVNYTLQYVCSAKVSDLLGFYS